MPDKGKLILFKNREISELEKILDYRFLDKGLINLAFIHKSYSNEKKEFKDTNNERLELLGDSVLDLIVTLYLYLNFPNLSEGEIVKLKSVIVSEPVLYEVALELNLGSYIFLSKGEEVQGGRSKSSILGDCFEAVLGAIFLDSGLEQAKKFVLKVLTERIDEIREKNYDRVIFDHKTILQEYTQSEYKQLPKYCLLSETGPGHEKMFEIAVKVADKIIGVGVGKSKKEAEQIAAMNACDYIKLLEE